MLAAASLLLSHDLLLALYSAVQESKRKLRTPKVSSKLLPTTKHCCCLGHTELSLYGVGTAVQDGCACFPDSAGGLKGGRCLAPVSARLHLTTCELVDQSQSMLEVLP